ncbi:hypothetical protein AXYL_06094 [Achromobacter xylosoxidans A8]|uniref:Uncharacterized protein n=1 Tax=Achromobacter xylosoxidans (strain A8) TaxID=762376 RepID=E3HLQ2_ACHXA|nr:hypothetical protein [Achromobacter xylosoxidans]ADP19387.1 hypothetical protein AXYL_06094 [Achromobacter xylosoxidans A8]
MSRALIRSLKKTQRVGARAQASAAQQQDARSAALSLLQRSVRFKHDRLAVLRLANAVQLGANVDETLWEYCHAVASGMADPTQLQKVLTLRRGTTDQPIGGITPAESNSRRQE